MLSSTEVLPPPRKIRATRDLGHLPGDNGLPIVGRTPDALADSFAFTRGMYERYGPVFRTQTFFEHRVVLVGPEAAELIFMDRERNFSSLLGWDRMLGRFFPKGLMLRDFDDHRCHRLVMQEAFKKPAMEAYLEHMNPHIAEVVAGWTEARQDRPTLFYDAVKQLTLDIAAVVFLGVELGREADRLNRALMQALGGVIAMVPVAVPGLATWRGLRGREVLYRYLAEKLPEKRRAETSDMFARLCHARTEDGSELSDDDVVNHMIFMLLAAHDTTTSALTTMAYTLARHPEWQDRLRSECAAVEAPLRHGDLHRFPRMEWVFKEALRLYPPVVTNARRSLREFEFGGFRIPANSAINLDVPLTHHLPEWWSDPHRFDPERFSDERAEHRRHRFSWIPFGGGAHMCLGMHFAYMQVKAILHQVLLRYRLTVADGYRMPYQLIPIPKPKDRLPLRLERL